MSIVAKHDSIFCTNTSFQMDQGSRIALFSDERAPADFQISSSSSSSQEDDNFDQLLTSIPLSTSTVLRSFTCPLCLKRKKNLTCQECLLKGEFSHMLSKRQQRRNNEPVDNVDYAKLQYRLLEKKAERFRLAKECEKYTKRKERISAIKDEMEKLQTRIDLERELKIITEKKITAACHESERLQKAFLEKQCMWPVCRSRLNNMQTQFSQNLNNLHKFSGHVKSKEEALKAKSKERIFQLKGFVFPIMEISESSSSSAASGIMKNKAATPSANVTSTVLQKDSSVSMVVNSVDSWSDEEDDTVSALMAATSNYYGRPDDMVPSFGNCYCIPAPFGPTLPASGDYSAYQLWTERGGVSSGSSTRNPAHCLSAALTYTTQFVNLAAFYLDLRLPHRLSYSEFTLSDLLGGKFSRKVAKLNANVIYLCASQGIPASFLQPRKTMTNISLLFDLQMSDLGRRGSFEVASQLAKSMEESIEKDLVIYEEDSDSDWSDTNFPSDWENVQKGAISEEYGCQQMTQDNVFSMNATVGQSDLWARSRNAPGASSSGLVSSMASFFRGWSK